MMQRKWYYTFAVGAALLPLTLGSSVGWMQRMDISLIAHAQETTTGIGSTSQGASAKTDSTASDSTADTTTGTLQLLLPGEAIGAEITLYPAAYLQDAAYVYSDAFSASGIEIADLSDAAAAEAAAEALAEYAAANGLAGESRHIDSESIVFEDLEPALYLTAQTAGTERIEIQAALVAVPRSSYGVPVYDVTISPKYSFPDGAVIINKVNEEGEPLAAAYFALQSKVYTTDVPDGVQSESDEAGSYYWKEYFASLVTGGNGQIVVTDLPFGSYRFVETQAPEGYLLLENPVIFDIEQAGTVELNGDRYESATGEPVVLEILNFREPETEPTTEPTTEPETEPTTEPIAEPETEPATEPTTEPETELTTEPTTEPITEPETEPITEPATDIEPATENKPTTETELTTEPTTETEIGPASTGTPGGGSSGGTSGGSSPKTGDETPLFTYLMMLILSGFVCCILVSRKRSE